MTSLEVCCVCHHGFRS